MYQALYRKWRPKSFDDVVGQEHITQTLKRQIMNGRLSHAYLFVGTRGTGKTTCAKILAKAANCENPQEGNPCNRCPSCRGIDSGAILDIEELDAASNNGVDNIRAIRDEAVYTPASVKKRVYIIDEVHMLSTAAFNALLKTLEEPPEHLVFILATTEVHKVPATILSRCQRYSFKRIPMEKIAGRLQYIAEREEIKLQSDAGELIAGLADGSMRDSLSLLDQCVWEDVVDVPRVQSVLGLAGTEATITLLRLCMDGDVKGALKVLGDLYFDGKEVGSVLNELMSLCRDVLITKLTKGDNGGLVSGRFSGDTLKTLAKAMRAAEYLRYIKTIQQSISDLTFSTSRRITAEMCLAELCSPSLSSETAAMDERIRRLEEKIKNGVPVMTPEAAPDKGHTEEKSSTSREELPWEVTPEDKSYGVPKKEKIVPQAPEPEYERPPFPEEEYHVTPPEPEEPYRPEPAVTMAPAETVPKASGHKPMDGDAAWQKILKMMEKKIDPWVYTFLGDRSHCVPKMTDTGIDLQTKSPIARSMLEVPAVTTGLKETAEIVLNRPVRVLVSGYKDEGEPETDKLEMLKKFSNIKFE